MISSFKFLLLCISIVTIMGCQGEHTGEIIEGRVTIQGEPMSEGLITFEPLGTTTGPKISTVIDKGNYSISSSEGIQSGQFRVEVLGIPPGVKAMSNGDSHLNLSASTRVPYREVASEFNFQSQLLATVERGVTNQFDFDVKLDK